MPLEWAGITTQGGDLADEDRQAVRAMLDRLGDAVASELARAGYRPHFSPLFRPWHLAVAKDAEKVFVVVAADSGGISNQFWLDRTAERLAPDELVRAVREERGWQVAFAAHLPHPGTSAEGAGIDAVARAHVAEIERQQVLGKLGDLTGVRHLEPHLREFLAAHPDPARNVFVMMRYLESEQLDQVYRAIKETLAARGLHAVRADDRDYTGELWSNVEVYLTCCTYGIAVFEDIEKRDFNPNVSLELGYMLGRRKRCLILKEQRLPDLPADVVHRLYKPWDVFRIGESVSREVGRWVDVDLGLAQGAG